MNWQRIVKSTWPDVNTDPSRDNDSTRTPVNLNTPTAPCCPPPPSSRTQVFHTPSLTKNPFMYPYRAYPAVAMTAGPCEVDALHIRDRCSFNSLILKIWEMSPAERETLSHLELLETLCCQSCHVNHGLFKGPLYFKEWLYIYNQAYGSHLKGWERLILIFGISRISGKNQQEVLTFKKVPNCP